MKIKIPASEAVPLAAASSAVAELLARAFVPLDCACVAADALPDRAFAGVGASLLHASVAAAPSSVAAASAVVAASLARASVVAAVLPAHASAVVATFVAAGRRRCLRISRPRIRKMQKQQQEEQLSKIIVVFSYCSSLALQNHYTLRDIGAKSSCHPPRYM